MRRKRRAGQGVQHEIADQLFDEQQMHVAVTPEEKEEEQEYARYREDQAMLDRELWQDPCAFGYE